MSTSDLSVLLHSWHTVRSCEGQRLLAQNWVRDASLDESVIRTMCELELATRLEVEWDDCSPPLYGGVLVFILEEWFARIDHDYGRFFNLLTEANIRAVMNSEDDGLLMNHLNVVGRWFDSLNATRQVDVVVATLDAVREFWKQLFLQSEVDPDQEVQDLSLHEWTMSLLKRMQFAKDTDIWHFHHFLVSAFAEMGFGHWIIERPAEMYAVLRTFKMLCTEMK